MESVLIYANKTSPATPRAYGRAVRPGLGGDVLHQRGLRVQGAYGLFLDGLGHGHERGASGGKRRVPPRGRHVGRIQYHDDEIRLYLVAVDLGQSFPGFRNLLLAKDRHGKRHERCYLVTVLYRRRQGRRVERLKRVLGPAFLPPPRWIPYPGMASDKELRLSLYLEHETRPTWMTFRSSPMSPPAFSSRHGASWTATSAWIPSPSRPRPAGPTDRPRPTASPTASRL